MVCCIDVLISSLAMFGLFRLVAVSEMHALLDTTDDDSVLCAGETPSGYRWAQEGLDREQNPAPDDEAKKSTPPALIDRRSIV